MPFAEISLPEQKRQLEQQRVARIVAWGVGVSLLVHGFLWAAMVRWAPTEAGNGSVMEVILSPLPAKRAPQVKKKLRLVANYSRPKTPRQVRQGSIKTAPKTSPRRTKHINRPEKSHTLNSSNNSARLAKLPSTPRQPSVFSSSPASQPALSPRLSSPPNSRPDSTAASHTFTGTRPFSRSSAGRPTTNSANNISGKTEFAALPENDGSYSRGVNRTGRRRSDAGNSNGNFDSGSTKVYLPDSGNSSNSGADFPRPTGFQSQANGGRDTGENAPVGASLRRQSSGVAPSLPRPESARPTAPSAETSDNTPAPENNAPRRPKFARRNTSDEPDLFPTPTPRPITKEAPLPEAKSEPKEEPEREIFRPARVRSSPKPEYPADAKANNQEGVVVLRLEISEAGRVIDATLVSGSGVASLDAASLRGVRRWTYEPARRGKTPVSSSLTARLRWRLTD